MISEKGGVRMKNRGLTQETLKLIACITMLLDHIGAVFVPGYSLRIIGRVAFPIYCFLLAEGVHYTRDPKRYGFRLLIGALLSEIPFDLLLFGRLTFAHQSVMITLLLGFLYAVAQRHLSGIGHKLLLILPFMVVADLLATDYGGWGVAMIGMFVLTREDPKKHLSQTIWMVLLSWLIGGATIRVGTLSVPIELFAVFALVPIFCYSGRKSTGNAWIQRLFYLFYPVHLAVLLLIERL